MGAAVEYILAAVLTVAFFAVVFAFRVLTDTKLETWPHINDFVDDASWLVPSNERKWYE